MGTVEAGEFRRPANPAATCNGVALQLRSTIKTAREVFACELLSSFHSLYSSSEQDTCGSGSSAVLEVMSYWITLNKGRPYNLDHRRFGSLLSLTDQLLEKPAFMDLVNEVVPISLLESASAKKTQALSAKPEQAAKRLVPEVIREKAPRKKKVAAKMQPSRKNIIRPRGGKIYS